MKKFKYRKELPSHAFHLLFETQVHTFLGFNFNTSLLALNETSTACVNVTKFNLWYHKYCKICISHVECGISMREVIWGCLIRCCIFLINYGAFDVVLP